MISSQFTSDGITAMIKAHRYEIAPRFLSECRRRAKKSRGNFLNGIIPLPIAPLSLILLVYCYSCYFQRRDASMLIHPCNAPSLLHRLIDSSIVIRGVNGWEVSSLPSTMMAVTITKFRPPLMLSDKQKRYSSPLGLMPPFTSATALKGTSKSIDINPSSILPLEERPDVVDNKNSVRQLPLIQLTCELQELLKQPQRQTIGVEGYITHKRSLGSSLAFIDLVQGENTVVANSSDVHESSNINGTGPPLQVLLKRQTYDQRRIKSSFPAFLKSLYPGMKVYMEGYAYLTQNGQVIFMVNHIKILGLSQNPHHLKSILQRIRLDDHHDASQGDHRLLGKDTGEGIDKQDEERKTGLSLDDVYSVFCIGNDTQKIKRVLRGTEDIANLRPNSVDTTNTSITTADTSALTPTMTSDEVAIAVKKKKDTTYSSTSPQEHQHQQQKQKQRANRHSFEKIARIITENIPKDPHYPTRTLQQLSKGNYYSVRSAGRSNDTNTGGGDGKGRAPKYTRTDDKISILPTAPSNIVTIPDPVRERIERRRKQQRLDSDGSAVGDPPMELESAQTKSDENSISMAENELAMIAGSVQNRRRFSGSITVLKINVQDSPIPSSGETPEPGISQHYIKCVLHPFTMDDLPASSSKLEYKGLLQSPVDVYGYLLPPGARVFLQGFWSSESQGSDLVPQEPVQVLWVTGARLLQSSWRPSIIRHFLTLLGGGSNDDNGQEGKKENRNSYYYPFDIDEVSEALNLPGGHEEARMLKKACTIEGTTEIQWRAAELSRRLQGEGSRMGTLTTEMTAVLEKFSQVRQDWPFEQDGDNTSESIGYPTATTSKAQIPVKIENKGQMKTMGSLLKSQEGSRWQRAKRPQLEWMKKQIEEVVQAHPDFQKRPLNILDIGGGRGFLANYLASTLGNDLVNVHVIDIDHKTVKNGMLNAQRNNLTVRYTVGDASTLNSAHLLNESLDEAGSGHNKFDVVVALHACGALSDVALGHACMHGAAFVITPCCFQSNPHLLVRLNDRKVAPSTWQNIPSYDLEALKRVAELQGDIHTAGLGMHSICAVRAKAAQYHHLQRRRECINATVDLEIKIKAFPMRYSTRNFCIVGKLCSKL